MTAGRLSELGCFWTSWRLKVLNAAVDDSAQLCAARRDAPPKGEYDTCRPHGCTLCKPPFQDEHLHKRVIRIWGITQVWSKCKVLTIMSFHVVLLLHERKPGYPGDVPPRNLLVGRLAIGQFSRAAECHPTWLQPRVRRGFIPSEWRKWPVRVFKCVVSYKGRDVCCHSRVHWRVCAPRRTVRGVWGEAYPNYFARHFASGSSSPWWVVRWTCGFDHLQTFTRFFHSCNSRCTACSNIPCGAFFIRLHAFCHGSQHYIMGCKALGFSSVW